MVELKKIAADFDLEIIGNEALQILKATSLDNPSEEGITWVKSANYLSKVECGVVLMHSDLLVANQNKAATLLITKSDPRLIFALILKKYFAPDISFYLKNCVEEHRLNNNVTIADNVFIGRNVTLGNGTVIFPNVVIEANSVIGEHCIIKSHTSIGTEGMGLELNPENGLLEKFPQIGNTELEDYVEIGPNSTIRRGALRTTIVRKGTKIGSLSNIGHNCDIGENGILTSGIIISGSSTVGNNVFIGVSTSVRNGARIGHDVEIGMGSVVVKDVPDGVTVFGNPAKVKGA